MKPNTPESQHLRQLFTPAEAAAFLRSNTRTLERWRHAGSGPIFAKIGRRVAYRPTDLSAWVEQRLFSHTHSEPAQVHEVSR